MLVKRYKFSYNNYMNNVELKLNMIAKEMDHLWNGMFSELKEKSIEMEEEI